MAKYVSIQDVVKDFLSEKGDYTDVDFLRYLKIAMRGFANLNIHTVKTFKTVTLYPNKLMQAPLPDDYVNWSRIGIMRGGEIIALDVNENLSLSEEVPAETYTYDLIWSEPVCVLV